MFFEWVGAVKMQLVLVLTTKNKIFLEVRLVEPMKGPEPFY